MSEQLRNWAGNYTYKAVRIHRPQTIEQLQALVKRSHKLKPLGTRHSFNGIADSPEDLVSLEHFNRVVALDDAQRRVTVEAGIRYGELCRHLHAHGYALHNLASLPHISVGGACATATHGSGDSCGNLATAVCAIELVTADGERRVVSREEHGERFHGLVVGLGALGVVTKLTLEIEPAFDMRQDVYEDLPLAQLDGNFDEVFGRAYSVSLFTDWQNARFNQVWFKRRIADGASFEPEPILFEARRATNQRHPITGLPPGNCTEQMGIAGAWHERLPHFRLDYLPSSGEELQSEYFVPRQNALAAFHTLDRLREQLAPLLQISEIRTIAADQLWLSPCYQQACMGIHFTWKKNWPAVSKLLPRLEAELLPLGARPHWAKLFTARPEQLRTLYPKLPDFQQLLWEYDPTGKFRNAFVETYIAAPR